MGEERKAAVLSMPFPRSAHELRRYLGCVNYMRRFIRDYSSLAHTLSMHVHHPVSDRPREEMLAAFTNLQNAVNEQLRLAHLDYTKPIFVATDASIIGVGDVLEILGVGI